MSPAPIERVVEIVNRAGMHARPASEFVKLAGQFKSEIRLEKDGFEVNGKSIMGVLMLAAEQGSALVMVTIAVITLGQYKLQERGGRWLKLLSGAVIVSLGVLLVLAPELLVL